MKGLTPGIKLENICKMVLHMWSIEQSDEFRGWKRRYRELRKESIREEV
jgi:hypothetical protein